MFADLVEENRIKAMNTGQRSSGSKETHSLKNNLCNFVGECQQQQQQTETRNVSDPTVVSHNSLPNHCVPSSVVMLQSEAGSRVVSESHVICRAHYCRLHELAVSFRTSASKVRQFVFHYLWKQVSKQLTRQGDLSRAICHHIALTGLKSWSTIYSQPKIDPVGHWKIQTNDTIFTPADSVIVLRVNTKK